jgi:chromosome segregation ATPase
MTPIEPITFSWLFNKAWVFLVALWLYDRKKYDNSTEKVKTRLDNLEKESIAIKSQFVTEEQMKQAIREALEPYREDQEEIKVLLKELNSNVVSLSKDMAVQDAIRRLHAQKTEDSSGI